MLRTKNKRELTERERKLNEYYWKCFYSEFSKICIFLIIFILLDLTTEYIFALLYLMVLRNNGGGLHCNSYISCLLVSFTFLYSSIILAIHITPTKSVACTSILFCALLVYFLVPATSNNRPAPTHEQIIKCKRNSIIIILIFFITICTCPFNIYVRIGYWTVILHILQLIIAHIAKEVKSNG
jgi:accessory gene regulator B